MKNIYKILGLLAITVSFFGGLEAAHHNNKNALLDAVNNPERNAKYSIISRKKKINEVK